MDGAVLLHGGGARGGTPGAGDKRVGSCNKFVPLEESVSWGPEGAGGFLSPSGAGDVREQLRRLQEERTCKVCLDRAVDVVFVPCGHLVCTECAPNLQVCPICRVPIGSCVRTFLS